MTPTRRQLSFAGLAALIAAGLSPLAWPLVKPRRKIPGALLGANRALGHRLRASAFPPPQTTTHHDVVIVGGGIAGLSAARYFDKTGTDFRLLDLEDHTGGNAHSGANNTSPYPWGAHYVPLLSTESRDIAELFREFGIITGEHNGLPTYNEDYILSDPDERLFISGRWQDGLIPRLGAAPDDEAQYKRFLSAMDAFKTRRGRDGKRWFAIPIDQSSTDAEARVLDTTTMKAWMDAQGYTSTFLHWYVDYGCRDDFGVPHDQISAYAGIHYFAARDGKAANAAPDAVITWPEGNGFLARKLAEPIRDRTITRALAHAVRTTADGVEIDYWDDATQKSRRLTARAAVLATPRFVTARLTGNSSKDFTYAPWVVANITLSRLPEGPGTPLAWDNVPYGGRTLGYVVATHQIPQMQPLKTVITWYWPLTHLAPAEARKEALARTYDDWQTLFLAELFRLHPELKDAVERLDVWLWGHAMIRPVPGFIWGDARRDTLVQRPPIFTAHSDMSGISIFEEAYSHGLNAARAAVEYLTPMGASLKSSSPTPFTGRVARSAGRGSSFTSTTPGAR